MTGPRGNSEFCFSRISLFAETRSREMFAMWQNKREATATTSDHLQLYCHRERGVKGGGVGGRGI